MAAINFPDAPTVDDKFIPPGSTVEYVWDGTTWAFSGVPGLNWSEDTAGNLLPLKAGLDLGGALPANQIKDIYLNGAISGNVLTFKTGAPLTDALTIQADQNIWMHGTDKYMYFSENKQIRIGTSGTESPHINAALDKTFYIGQIVALGGGSAAADGGISFMVTDATGLKSGSAWRIVGGATGKGALVPEGLRDIGSPTHPVKDIYYSGRLIKI